MERFSIGDRVVVAHGTGGSFTGTVQHVISPEDLQEGINEQAMLTPRILEALKLLDQRDSDWANSPVYLVNPDSNSSVASYEQAKVICPALTAEQYELIVRPRSFIALDSDLLEIGYFDETGT